jgi:hypothetical protein
VFLRFGAPLEYISFAGHAESGCRGTPGGVRNYTKMDTFVRADHFRKIAGRYEELAKLAQVPHIGDLYRKYAARYVRMADGSPEQEEAQAIKRDS